MIFALNQMTELTQRLGIKEDVGKWKKLETLMKNYARKNMYNSSRRVFLSGKDNQFSVLSQVWMIKSGVIFGKKAQTALRSALASAESVKPGTPYATHYVIDAMLISGMKDEARKYLEDYWGGMVRKGADTFWEAYDPNDDFISPYNFSPLNSACHAWSCTPVYFIHKYPEVFQKGN